MNPLYQAIMGGLSHAGGGMNNSAPTMPNAGFGGVLNQAQQLANTFRNPQALVQRFMPDAPAEIQNDPEQLIGWLQQTGRINPQMVQMARQMMGR